MLDVMDLSCPLLRAPFFEQAMILFGYFGHGAVIGAIGPLLLAHGYFYHNDRSKKAGVAVIVALIVAGTAAELLKYTVQLPRPRLRSSYGFPSGHTSAAFGLAATLGATFPQLSPLFYALAVLAGISRLYLRAHYTLDVIAGMAIGLIVGVPVAKRLIPTATKMNRGLLGFLAWVGVFSLGLGGLAFFYSGEKNIAAHMIMTDNEASNGTPLATFDFGTPQARPLLRYGWSGDESWYGGQRSVVWASGLASEIAMDLPAARDYVFRFNVFPYSPKGPACQRIEVKVNDTVVTKVFLEQGWHWYKFDVPMSAVKAGTNSIQFFYDYAEPPKLRGRSTDERLLSVAFDVLQATAKN